MIKRGSGGGRMARIACLTMAAAIAGAVPASAEVAIRLSDAVVVRTVPANGDDARVIEETAEALTNVIFRKTGRQARILDRAPADAKAAVFLGEAAIADGGFDVSSLRNGDWRVKAVPGKVYLVGTTAWAVECAMVEFADRFCDYLFLTPDGKDPCAFDAALTVPVCDMTVRPAIYCRRIDHGRRNVNRYPKAKGPWDRYARHRRAKIPVSTEGVCRVSPVTPGGHSTFHYLPPERWFKTHPEYFAMTRDGARNCIRNAGGQICYSNPEVLEHVFESLVAFVEKERAADPVNYPRIFDFTQMDRSDALCLCPACRETIARYNRVAGGHKEGGDAGLQLEFANKLARRIRERYPDVQIRVFAYTSTECPPKPGTIRPEPNVVIWWCDVYSHSDHTVPLETSGHFNELQASQLKEWLALTKNIHVWDYMLYDSGCPQVSPDAIAQDARFFARNGVPALFVETEYHDQPFYMLNFYLMSELYIDPGQDVERLISRYCRVYGKAASEMEDAIGFLRKIEREGRAACARDWHSGNWPWRTAENMYALAGKLAKAYDKESDPDMRSRVVEALVSTWHEIVMILKRNPKAGEAYAAAQRTWLRYAKERARSGFVDWRDRADVERDVEDELEVMTLRFRDLPDEVKDIPSDRMLCLDYHFRNTYKALIDDPRSERGRAVATFPDDKTADGPELDCGVYDRDTKQAFNLKLKVGTLGEGYRWQRVGRVHIGTNSMFWFPGSWRTYFSLIGQFIECDGMDKDPNWYDLWVSSRFVEGETGSRRMFIDRLLFVREP